MIPTAEVALLQETSLISKHRLEFDRDALKKILKLARNPAKLIRTAERDIQRHHSSHPLLPIRRQVPNNIEDLAIRRFSPAPQPFSSHPPL